MLSGATVPNLNHYSTPKLIEDNPDIVVIHGRINNLLSMTFKTVSDDKLVEEIINVRKKCSKDHGVKKVFISSLTPSSHIDYNSLSNINKCGSHYFNY